MNYQRQLTKVIEFIGKHLDEKFTLTQLSDVACFSKYHFHRVFTAYMGLSLHRSKLQQVRRPEKNSVQRLSGTTNCEDSLRLNIFCDTKMQLNMETFDPITSKFLFP